MTAAARWRGVLALAAAVTTSWGVLYYSFGVFITAFEEELGASKALVGGAFSVALLAAAAVSGAAGRGLDRWGARRVMTVASLGAAAAFALLSKVAGVAQLYALWMVIGVTHAGTLYEPAFAAVARWFPEPRERTRALLVVTSVGGFASTLFLPLAALLCARYGWRDAALILAAVLAAITIPLHATLPRDAAGAAPRGDGAADPPPTDGVRRLAMVSALQAFVSAGVTVHVVGHLRGGGLELGAAAGIAGIMGAAQVPGRVLFAPFARWIGPRWRLPALLSTQGVALLGVAGLRGAPLVAAVALFGAANGMLTLERATLVAERWGVRHYGALSGRIATWSLLGRAAAPATVGLVALAGGSSALTFVLLAAVLAGAAGLARP